MAVLYPHPGFSLPVWQTAGAVLALTALTLAVARLSRTYQYVGMGWVWYLVTLPPVIGLIQIGQHAMADRFAYIPLIGIFIIVAWGAPDLFSVCFKRQPDTRVFTAMAGAVIAAYTICAWVQSGYFGGTA